MTAAMSDRVAVFHDGRVEQVGTPKELYEQPANEFVAGFVGTANLLRDGAELVTVRPERIRFGAARGDELGASGTVDDVQYLGPVTRYRVHTSEGASLVVEVPNTEASPPAAVGDHVQLAWRHHDRQRVGSSHA